MVWGFFLTDFLDGNKLIIYPNWHEDTFNFLFILDQILSAEFLSKISKLWR